MQVEVTPAALEVVERAGRDRSGTLVITIGTGCCESTAPFLYEDFWPGPDQEQVGVAGDVPVFAPEYLRRLYPDDDPLVIDVDRDYLGESLSIETEYDCRLTLRVPGQVVGDRSAGETCRPRARTVEGSLPEALQNLRIR